MWWRVVEERCEVFDSEREEIVSQIIRLKLVPPTLYYTIIFISKMSRNKFLPIFFKTTLCVEFSLK